MAKTVFRNRLAEEKSPYLIQHAENPVNWYPWGQEAFEEARKQNKPIFLSIGYSTCHWCHVMAHESFEDKEVAAFINELFIPIKVDREERPDIDNAYMTVCQMMTGSGGWPLTILMTAEKKPFLAATYIPKKSRFGRKGLMELLEEINKKWEDNRAKVLDTADRITELLNKNGNKMNHETSTLSLKIFDEAFIELEHSFDDQYGGFGHAPKFPIPHQNTFLLKYYRNQDNDTALSMVEKNLLHMRAGGIYDHIGYGFHRYSTDEKWNLPHFEKMLYDQALLIKLYTTAYQITGKDVYKNTTEEIITYIKNKMTDPEGGFYSAEDADSEGEEGKFYTWRQEDIEEILNENTGNIIELYNINKEGNFSDESTGKRNGTNILFLDQDNNNIIELLEEEQKYSTEKTLLYTERQKRIHPYKDDKILTDWNGLMISALARASFVFNNDEYLELAENAAHFIKDTMIRDNELLHRYRDGDAAI
ncbi:MAG: thioredoxin domain-containing protein, partial [bacterium]